MFKFKGLAYFRAYLKTILNVLYGMRIYFDQSLAESCVNINKVYPAAMPSHSALDSVVQYTIAKYLFFYFNVSPAQFSGLSMPYISDDRKRAHF